MRAKEFINESEEGHISKRQQQSTTGLNTFSDGERWNTDYVAYRLGIAAASTDGDSEPNIDAKSWVGKQKTAHPYTKQEQKMLKKAYKAVGASYKDLNHGDMKSKETDDTNKASPISGFKGFKK